ncbi:MAG: cob(I)yrinic acid a,c-diamide adenosyltransferase [Myxococcota bacterium]|nr:cob(I)yrinic acid a,c-diamide adenosyltransferase [Myxococcota bacterium]MDW8361605.1 cob(I)yrinic acid a,c-diamide adenosyltransferase [Myxococcales bacterium]
MKIYTKTGDDGRTGLFGGGRVPKDHARVEAYGALDELGAWLGLVRAEGLDEEADAWLARVQSELFDLGAELATAPEKRQRVAVEPLDDEATGRLESQIDAIEAELPPLRTFILAGGCRAAALLHVARTVCRRAERRIVTLSATEPVRPEVIRYVNRLSDFLFVLARRSNARAAIPDVPWIGRRRS